MVLWPPRKVNNADGGTADLYGGNDIDAFADYYGNVDLGVACTIASETRFRSDKFRFMNPANTFYFTHVIPALAGNRQIIWPLLTADDEPLFKGFAAIVSNKTLDATCNVSAAVGGAAALDAQYLTLALHGSLTNERLFALGDALTATDGGAGGNYTINFDILDFARKRVHFYDDFLGKPANWSPFDTTFGGTGTTGSVSAIAVGETGVFGVWQLSTGVIADGYAEIICAGLTSVFSLGQGIASLEAYIQLPTLSTSTDEYVFRFGFMDSSTAGSGTDGVFFEYSRPTSVNWRIRCLSNSIATNMTSSTAVSTSWTRLKIVVNAAGTSASFFINGTEVANSPITTNIPVGAGRELSIAAYIVKSVGTTARTAKLDYVAFDMDLTTAR